MERQFMGARVMSLQAGIAEAEIKALIVCQPISTPMEDTPMDNHELTLTALLDDPMTRAVMAADRVDQAALKAVLSAVARRLQHNIPDCQRKICGGSD
jgi:hypothetical protein